MTKKKPDIIAIDGPAASGKSTLGHRLANALGYLFFDTGVMYRAVTWLVLQSGINVRDEKAITALAEKTQMCCPPRSLMDARVMLLLKVGTLHGKRVVPKWMRTFRWWRLMQVCVMP